MPAPSFDSSDPPGPSQFGALLGFKIRELDPALTRVSMPVSSHLQPAGLLHGGATLALCEEAASLAANEHARQFGKVAVGINVSVSHLAPGRAGTVTCEAVAERLGRRTTVHRVAVYSEGGELISVGLVTNQLIAPR